MERYRIGLVGCAGRMGRMLLKVAAETEGCTIAAGTEAPDSPVVGQDLGAQAGLGELGITVGADPVALFTQVDAVIDFTVPAISIRHAELAAQAGSVLVLGTTGFDKDQDAAIARAARHATIVQAANMSLGVNVLLELVERTARMLDPDFDIEIMEIHHRYKVDAPSGTALALGKAAAKGRAVDLDEVAQKVRDGVTGPRRRGDIGFATLRGGDVAGEHTVALVGDGERIELTHRATTREVFARGAIKAALWARGKPPGLYSMRDVLGLD